jgi:hypothetical protein
MCFILAQGSFLPDTCPDIAMSAPEPFHQTSFALALTPVHALESAVSIC